jgi:hypothetical protein
MTEWGHRIVYAMEKARKDKISVPTDMFGSIYVKESFQKRNPEISRKLNSYCVSNPRNCPMIWCSTSVEGAELVATNSHKTRVYMTARFFRRRPDRADRHRPVADRRAIVETALSH